MLRVNTRVVGITIKIMFVSYRTCEGEYGYMCFTDTRIEISKLHKYIESRLFRKTYLQFISQYSTKTEHWVQMHINGLYLNKLIQMPLSNVDDVNKLYIYLYRKYGFTNILGFN